MSEQQVLVTGACGEIGQALVQGLAKTGRIQNSHSGFYAACQIRSKIFQQNMYKGIWFTRSKLFTITISILFFISRHRFHRRPKWPRKRRIASTWKARCNC